MEDELVLRPELYAPKRPLVCFDETSEQLKAKERSPILPRWGRTAGADLLRAQAQWIRSLRRRIRAV